MQFEHSTACERNRRVAQWGSGISHPSQRSDNVGGSGGRGADRLRLGRQRDDDEHVLPMFATRYTVKSPTQEMVAAVELSSGGANRDVGLNAAKL
jgi:hypothetical protein